MLVSRGKTWIKVPHGMKEISFLSTSLTGKLPGVLGNVPDQARCLLLFLPVLGLQRGAIGARKGPY
jgi:hypothetical protein